MYTLDIIVTKEEVEIIKRELKEYVEESDGFTFTIYSDNGVRPSPELEDVIKKMFFNMMMTIVVGKFRGVN